MSAAERRLVMFVVVALVFVLAWMAFTNINDPGKTNAKIKTTEENIDKFKAEIAKDIGYKKRIAELEGLNSAVENRNQEVDLIGRVTRLQSESGLNIFKKSSPTSKPGDFFVEQSMRIQFNGKEEQIVNFLMRLGSDEDSLMRISRFDISPDGRSNPTKLKGSATVMASYQKDYVAPPPPSAGKGTVKSSGTSEPAEKPEAKPETKPAGTKRRIPTRRVRTPQ